ncbi:MAG: YhcH/YjgK/YiaL family protein [Candidatus Gastranaerophilaceae bacterium]
MEKNVCKDERIKQVINYMKSLDFETLEDGRLEISESVWANLQTYMTKEDALFEAHRKYIDIQYMIIGQEKIGVCDYTKCKTNIPYDSKKDIEFLDCENDFEYINMNPKDFLVLYPNDAHKPSISSTPQPTKVRKLVAKIPVIL